MHLKYALHNLTASIPGRIIQLHGVDSRATLNLTGSASRIWGPFGGDGRAAMSRAASHCLIAILAIASIVYLGVDASGSGGRRQVSAFPA